MNATVRVVAVASTTLPTAPRLKVTALLAAIGSKCLPRI